MTNFNYTGNKVINGTNDADFIYNDNANNVTIYAGSGNDQITNDVGRFVYLDGGDGKDTLITDESEGALSYGGDYATLVGGAGNDVIFAWADHAFVDAGADNDYIQVSDYSTITSGTGEDTMYCSVISQGEMTITDFDETKDVLELDQSIFYATGDSKLFTVTSYTGGVILENKYNKIDFKGQTLEHLKKVNVTYQNPIESSSALPKTYIKLSTLIYGTSEPKNNIISNTANNAMVAGSDDNDIITNTGSYVTIHGNGGNDSIVSGNDSEGKTINYNVTINSGTGDDTVEVYSSNVAVYGGEGDDYLLTWYLAEHLTIDAGKDSDIIENYAAKTSINGGSGNDVIRNFSGQNSYVLTATDVTMNGGSGNDAIYLSRYPEIAQYESGNDIIYNYSSTDKIQLLSGNISKASLKESDVIVTIGDGSITIKDAKDEKITIVNAQNETITFTNNYDSKSNRNDTDTTIYNGIDVDVSKSSLASLKVAKDILSALNKIAQSKLDNKDDTSFIGSVAGTISSLYAIVNSAIKMGDSKYSNDESKKLNESEFYKEWLNLGTNVTKLSSNLPKMLGKAGFVTPLSSYVMTLVTNVIASSGDEGAGKDEVAAIMESSLNIAAQTIKLFGNTAFGKTIAGGILNKLATNVASKAFWLIPPIVGLYVGYETYKENLGTYSDDGYEESITIRNAFIDGAVDFLHTTFTKWTFGLDDDVFNAIQSALSWWTKKRGLKEVELTDRNYMEWIGEAIKIVMDGAMHIDVTAKDGKLSNTFDEVIINGRSAADEIRNHGNKVSIYGCSGDDTVTTSKETSKNYVHLGKGNDLILVDDTDSTIYGDGDDDSIYVGADSKVENGGHEIYGEAGNDVIYLTNVDKNTISGGKGNDIIILEKSNNQLIIYGNSDGNDIIFGYNETDKIRLAATTYSTIEGEKDITIKSGSGSIVLSDAKGKKLNISSRYDVKNATSVTLSDTTVTPFKIGSNIVNIDATKRTKPIKINGNTLANIINGGSDSDSIYGGTGNDSILGNAGNDKLYGEAGADTLAGGKGNDTLTGGAGNDVFIYKSGQGNDIVTDYSTSDKVSITGGKYIRSTVGNDVKFTVGTGSILLKGAKTKNIIVSGTEDTKSTTSIVLTNSDKSSFTAISNIKTINASNRSRAIKITGNALANTIRGGSVVDTIYGAAGNDSILGNNGNDKLFGDNGNDTIYGGAGNDSIQGGAGADKLFGDAGADTLVGGKGNDTFTGGAGNDVFVYASGDGNDVITDYTAGQDKIKITGAKISKASVSGSDVILTVGSGKITVKNGKNKKLSIYNNSNSLINTIIGGNKVIENYTNRKTISGTSSNDTIDNVADNVTINSGAGNDSIVSWGDNIKINAGAGNDKVYATGEKISMLGGAGNDSLNCAYGHYATINGGKGNDTLSGSSYADVFQYSNGDGNDVIYNYDKSDKILLSSSSSYSTMTSGQDIVVKVDSGKMTLKYAKGTKLNIVGGKKNSGSNTDTEKGENISNSTKNKTINGSSGKDTISNIAGGVKIYAAAGNDSIYSSVSSTNTIRSHYGYVTIDGGTGNDTIYNNDPYISINGGTGNDSIYNNYNYMDYDCGYYVTMKGGAGNDTITKSDYSMYNVIQYASGDGNDIINGYNSSDTIQISGSSYSTQASGNNVIIKVGNGQMTLKDAKGTTLNITGTSNYEERWFLEGDDNYLTADVSNILKNDNLIADDYKLESELQFYQGNELESLTHNYNQLKHNDK